MIGVIANHKVEDFLVCAGFSVTREAGSGGSCVTSIAYLSLQSPL